ncbi:leucine-rich repeat domain-containing protein [Hymenobacter lapidiphilus]|uniref:Leucine-rich repeat domain-containing protein n=1 Tax=Hymenobacter lapidiphilus TaxID=2608003 RepID=A0A7Y7U773_9BACT|nr:leucine-rich repeat domain-containing protein [Hymenobacter lapidiphilus]NVO33132.1 leucine-rich repeat domain-containing protein [Hymenobacter lapidiphilus]
MRLSFMALFERRLFTSIPEALAAPVCYRLHLWIEDSQVQEWGPQLLRLPHLRELHLKGLHTVFNDLTYDLPEAWGQLRALREVQLLNLPVAFPTWVRNLPDLRTLTVRGTDATCLPEWIAECQALQTLRMENCALQTLPDSLRHMVWLRHLGLSDTQLPRLDAAQFPRRLRSLDLGGSRRYSPADLERLRQELRSTKVNPRLLPL